MRKKTPKAQPERDYVVISVKRHGLDRMVSLYGPFTKAHAFVYAQHREMYEGDECSVEAMEKPCEHNQWIFEGI
jgi:hypothetical protein